MSGTLQALKVEIAFTTTPYADPSTLAWTDVSALVLPDGGGYSRGQPDELSQMQAGTATFTLDNPAGQFDTDNASGPYYPNFVDVPIRVSTVYSATTYVLFYGFIDSWEQHFDFVDMRPTVVITAADGLTAILSYLLGQGYTDMLVTDYGGAVDTANPFVWPWQGAIPGGYYNTSGLANTSGFYSLTARGIAETAVQMNGSGQYLYWVTGGPGAVGYWLGIDGWFRIDSVPTGSPACLFMNGNSAGTNVSPNLGFGPQDGLHSLAGYVVNYPTNILANALADPTVTTGWATTFGTVASVAIASTNAVQRIYLDNGATDFYGATKAMRLTTTGAGSADLTSPFTAATAGQQYEFQAVLTQENSIASTSTLYIDWYNGATLLSSSSLASGLTTAVFGPTVLKGALTAPAGTTQFKFHWALNVSAGTSHFDMAQLIVVAYQWDNLTWYTGTPSPGSEMLFIVAAGANVNPPGQSPSANGWPCYAIAPVPNAGTWTHVAVDVGSDSTATPYGTATATRGMPQLWVNGAAVRMWTTGPQAAGLMFNAQCISGLGARFYGATPTVAPASETAMTADELYIPDSNIGVAGEVTAAKALAHYTYGLHTRDFVQQDTGARVNAILDSFGWPSLQRTVDTGVVTVLAQLPSTSLTGQSLLEDANTAEGGLYFVGRDGKFVFWSQTHQAFANYLTSNESTFEGGIGGWTALTNCTIAQTALQAHSGTKSLKMTSIAAASMTAQSGFYAATPGQTWYSTAWLLAAVTSHVVRAQTVFYDASFTLIGGGGSGAATDTSWVQAVGTSFVAPAGTAWVAAWATILSPSAGGEIHYVDDVQLLGPAPASLTIGDGPGEVPYQQGPVVSKDNVSIENDIQLTQDITDGSATTGAVVTLVDTASSVQHKDKALSLTAPWANVADMNTLAAAILADYKTPKSRIAAVSVEGVSANAWALLLPRDIGDLITVNIRPKSTGPTVTVTGYLQSISLNISPDGTWLFTYALAPTIGGH
jgi:hypothetical protein